ncbi:DEAD-box ATP-dependent RNA helicase CshA [Streptomyces leeuwenhoekii]|uniref:RNA helicase n=3 Tax=Streptomyces leeuwenhoekii TaxID=1437453 RepID=A0A0F7VWW0_STRLW|nr:DEAD-box ATP-dependent RNA helicase CshA [Streptomyces leeuwenhoekii]
MPTARPRGRPKSPARSRDTTPALASRRTHRRGSTLTTTFRSLGILPETAEALEAVGIITPFPIQEMTLPVALSGSDVIGQAKTGTGKTLGFGLPLLERVTVPADVEAGRARPEALTDAPQALVVVPTRELCVQVTNDLLTAGKARNVRVTAIYGGRAYEPQVEALKKGVDVVVGTPGRLLDLAGQKKLDLKHVKCLVLDEADEMLDLGFLPDVEKIIGMLPAKRQTMLFSATMPGAVIGLARRYMSRPTHIRATAPDDEGMTVANIKQFVYRAHSMDKPEMIARILQAEGRGLAMIFCRTKRTAADIAEQLQRRGFAAGAVHGDLGQGAREQALRAFRNGKVDVLVCTDVAARGIDVEGVTHVINYQSPEDEKTYLHRVGRTGRAGAKGTAITFVDWDDIPRWQLINKALQLDFNDPVETYSSSPHLYSDLGIPEGTKGVLPRSSRTRAGLDAEELEDLGEPGGRAGRGRGGRGDRDDRRDSRPDDRERSDRTPRRRRRTRGGAALDTASPATAAPDAVTAGGTEGTAEDADKPGRTLRRRRRTRGGAATRQPVTGATAEASVTTAPPRETAPEDTATAPEAAPVASAETAEAPAQPRRRRTRKTAQSPDAAAVTATEESPAAGILASEAPAAPAPLTEAATAPEAPAAKPRRRTRKAAATADAAVETAEATTETAEAKPRRTRKAAAKAETPETPEGAETVEAKPRRTRKTAAKTETTGDATAEATDTTEPKPRRTRKTAAKAETPEGAEAAEAKPRRTRKAAAKAETTDTAEATDTTEAKPRRTRKATAKTETTGDATAEATDTTEPKPRRTRKTAAKAETPEGAEAAEAKPRRTRKAAAKAETTDTAEATDTTEAKPRRTRKATAKTETTGDATAEAAEAKPRRRARKAAAEAEAVTAGIPAQATQEPEAAPRRRTRKAVTADAGESSGEAAEAKPKARRTRKATAAAAQPAESTEG